MVRVEFYDAYGDINTILEFPHFTRDILKGVLLEMTMEEHVRCVAYSFEKEEVFPKMYIETKRHTIMCLRKAFDFDLCGFVYGASRRFRVFANYNWCCDTYDYIEEMEEYRCYAKD